MAYHRIHRYTSIARPPDIRQLSGKVILAVGFAAALLGALMAWRAGLTSSQVFHQAVGALLAVYGSWALARELVPDDPIAPYLSMAAGLMVVLVVTSPGILVLYTTLILVRMVNRSSGLVARKTDSVGALLLVLWVIYVTDSPLYGVVAGLAFLLDGSLREPLRPQWIYGLVCFGGAVVYMVDHDAVFSQFAAPVSLFDWLALLFLFIFALNTLLLKTVKSTGDANAIALDTNRVKGGMVVGFLCAAQGISNPENVVLIVAAIAGICFGMAFRKGFNAPAQT